MIRKFVLVALTLLAACGGESTAPGGETGETTFRIASKAMQDTIGAKLTSAVQITVNDSKSRPRSQTLVTLHVVPDRSLTAPGVLLAGGLDSVIAIRTSANGTVNVDVTLGTHPGVYGVSVSVEGVTRQDTVTFTVLPGAPTSMRIASHDTLITVGVPYRPMAVLVDRLGNVRTDVVPLATLNSACQINGGDVTASDVTQCFVIARSGALRDSVRLTAFPRGRATFVVLQSNGWWFGTMNLDGSDMKIEHPVPKLSAISIHPVLSSGGIYASAQFGADGKTHIQLDDAGGSRFVPVSLPLGAEENWPLFSPDGQTLYFTACNSPIGEQCRVWQTRLDGSEPRILTPSLPISSGRGSNWAALSGDGHMLAYAGASGIVHTLDLLSGRDIGFGLVSSEAFGLDSAGTRVAMVRINDGLHDPLVISNIDGTNQRILTPGQGFVQSAQWLPGDTWILSRLIISSGDTGHTGSKALVNVNTGEMIAFDYKTNFLEVYVSR